jgi:hypothetical protein
MRSYDLLFIQNVTKIVCTHNLGKNTRLGVNNPNLAPFYKVILNNSLYFHFLHKENPNLENVIPLGDVLALGENHW